MFKKVLLPTDGSDISTEAALEGVNFAGQNRAEVLGLFVAPEYQYPVSVGIIPPTYPTEDEYEESMRKIGEEYLQPIREAAEGAGLPYSGMVVFANATGPQIAAVAKSSGCDLIFMASHGRTGLSHLLLGSVTSKVLSTCTVPVLVYRRKNPPKPVAEARQEIEGF